MKLSIAVTALFMLITECPSAYAAANSYYQGTVANIQAGWAGEGYSFQLNPSASATYSSIISGSSCTGANGTNSYAISSSQTLFYPMLKQLFYAYSHGQTITVVLDNSQCGFTNRGYVISIFNP